MIDQKASALIVAMMMILILSIVSISLLNFISFYYLDSSRLYEREKLKLISEKELLDTIIAIKKGELFTNSQLKTNTDNFEYEVSKKVSSTNNLYEVILNLKSQKASISRVIKFYILLPTDFSYILTSKLKVQNSTKCVFWGYSFIKDFEGSSSDTFFSFSYPPIFSDNTNLSIKSYIANADISPETPSLNLNIRYETNVVNKSDVRVSVDEIIKKAQSVVDKNWVINRYDGEVEQLSNPLIFQKTFLGVFYYSNPKVKVGFDKIDNIYFSDSKNPKITINNVDTYGSRGEITRKFINIENGFLSFITYPVEIPLSPEAFKEPFKIKLNTKDLKIVSRYRKIIGIYLDNTNDNLLNNGVILKDGNIEIQSDDVKERYYVFLGIGDGIRNKFRISKDINPQKVYVGGKEVGGFFVENFELVLQNPPAEGEEILIMKKIPKIFIQKSLPPNGIYLFSDKTENCAVIDFDKIQNLPKNKIIFSYLPLIVRGSPNESVIVISTENVYIDNINNTQNPKTVAIISSKGVFLSETTEAIRNVIIVSRLDGLYRITPFRIDDISMERSKWVFGTVILTGELMNEKLHSNESNNYYIISYEDPINNSTFSISERVMKDYLSDSEFGRNIRNLIPPIVVINKIK